jgi:antitoxin component of MazEF toxin-antitoxin module
LKVSLLETRVITSKEGSMKTVVESWRSDPAVRLPWAFAWALGLRENSSVEMTVHEGVLVIAPAPS